MKCIKKDCRKEASIGCSGLCRQHYYKMLDEQKESNPEIYQENILC